MEPPSSAGSARTSRRSRRVASRSVDSPQEKAKEEEEEEEEEEQQQEEEEEEAWREDAGEELASEHWRGARAAIGLPASAWEGRRQWCARTHGCEACARYVADGRPFEFAVQSQKVLDILASPGGYGSMRAAHEAGWRWNASPNHGSSSHQHQWWPPQQLVEELLPTGAKLPLGTNAALALLGELPSHMYM